MNKLATLSLLAAAALTVAPKPAQAGDKEAAIIGGMIIGGVIGAVIANNTDNCGPAPVYCPPAPVVYQPVACPPTGYWNEVRVQVWVPGCWSYRYDHGRQVRYYVSGHHEWRTNRVWVAHNNRYDNNRYDDHRGGREVSRGYGRDNDRNRNDDRRRNH